MSKQLKQLNLDQKEIDILKEAMEIKLKSTSIIYVRDYYKSIIDKLDNAKGIW